MADAVVRRITVHVTDAEVRAAVVAGWGRQLMSPSLVGAVRRALEADRRALARRLRAELGDAQPHTDGWRDATEIACRIVEGEDPRHD